MSAQSIKETSPRPRAWSWMTENLGPLFLLAALAAHSFGKQDSPPPVPTPSKPCVMTLTETTCPK